MAVTVRITVEDVADQIGTYDVIRVYRSPSVDGSFTLQDTITLVSTTFHYSYADATGTINSWYKWSLYNSVGPVESDLSAPFRPGNTSRLRIRQAAIERHKAGLIFTAYTGSLVGKLFTQDPRFFNTLHATDYGKGATLYPTNGNAEGEPRLVVASNPTLGTFDVEPDWSGVPINGDEVEWHWLTTPNNWDDAINQGFKRYWYVDRVPIRGVKDQEEYDLSFLTYIRHRRYIKNVIVRWENYEYDEMFGTMGRWWKVKQDKGALTLQIWPTISANDVLYLEVVRQMPPLYNDTDSPPPQCNEDLAVALAYDEVLAAITKPQVGSRVDRSELLAERVRHQQSDLSRLLTQERATWSISPQQGPEPTPVPRPVKAR